MLSPTVAGKDLAQLAELLQNEDDVTRWGGFLLSPQLEEAFMEAQWPGFVREFFFMNIFTLVIYVVLTAYSYTKIFEMHLLWIHLVCGVLVAVVVIAATLRPFKRFLVSTGSLVPSLCFATATLATRGVNHDFPSFIVILLLLLCSQFFLFQASLLAGLVGSVLSLMLFFAYVVIVQPPQLPADIAIGLALPIVASIPVFCLIAGNISRARRVSFVEQVHEKVQAQKLQESAQLLDSILNVAIPASIVSRLKDGEEPLVDSFAQVGVCFCRFGGLEKAMKQRSAEDALAFANVVFSTCDALAEQHGVLRIKIIDDVYLAVAGAPTPSRNCGAQIADFALALKSIAIVDGTSLSPQIGINAGPISCGVFGITRFCYDLWGDTVNVASRMMTTANPRTVAASEALASELQTLFNFRKLGKVNIKGKGTMEPSEMLGRKGMVLKAHTALKPIAMAQPTFLTTPQLLDTTRGLSVRGMSRIPLSSRSARSARSALTSAEVNQTFDGLSASSQCLLGHETMEESSDTDAMLELQDLLAHNGAQDEANLTDSFGKKSFLLYKTYVRPNTEAVFNRFLRNVRVAMATSFLLQTVILQFTFGIQDAVMFSARASIDQQYPQYVGTVSATSKTLAQPLGILVVVRVALLVVTALYYYCSRLVPRCGDPGSRWPVWGSSLQCLLLLVGELLACLLAAPYSLIYCAARVLITCALITSTGMVTGSPVGPTILAIFGLFTVMITFYISDPSHALMTTNLALLVPMVAGSFFYKVLDRFLNMELFELLSRARIQTTRIRHEGEKAERLLNCIYPAAVVKQLLQNEALSARVYSKICVLYCDIVGFTSMSSTMSSVEVITMCNALFRRFDEIIMRGGLEKLKTIGDAYVCAGLHVQSGGVKRMVAAANSMIHAVEIVADVSVLVRCAPALQHQRRRRFISTSPPANM